MVSENSAVGFDEPTSSSESISQVVEKYEKYCRRVRSLAEDTIAYQRVYLGRFLAFQQASSPKEVFARLTWQGVQRFMFRYAEEHSNGSRRWMKYSLRGFLRFCYHSGYVPSDLSDAVPGFCNRRLAVVPKAIDDSTVVRLIASLQEDSPLAKRDLAIIQLLVTYGVRGVQVRNLRLDDLDWGSASIRFRAVKGGKNVVQHLTNQVGNSLLAYIRDGRPSSVHPEVFLTSRPPFRPFKSSGSFSSIIARRLRSIDAELPAGVSRGAHSFRHAFASRLTGRVPFKHIADMLGHRDLSSTYVYSKVDLEALSQAALPWPEAEVQ
jgi:integrase